MKTKLGRFVSGKTFPVCFYLFLIFTAVYISFRTGNTAQQLLHLHMYGAAAVFFFLLFFLQWVFRRQHSFSSLRRFWLRVEGTVYCFLFYFILNLLCCDAVGLIVFLYTKNYMVFAVSWCIAVGISIVLLIYGAIHARHLKAVHYAVPLGNGEHTYRMVLLSDLHIGVFVGAGYIRKVVDRVNSLSPDMVVITGDLFDNGYAEECGRLDAVSSLLRSLQAKDGVYAVLGNHDPAFTDRKIQQFFQDAHNRLLYNEVKPFPLFDLAGRNDLLHYRRYAETRTPLNELLPQEPRKKPVVVLDHNPEGINEAVECKADLVLCGHTHKGQFFPLTLFTRLSHEKNHFYGQANFEETQVVISAGTGYFQLPVRLGTNSEIVEIILKL